MTQQETEALNLRMAVIGVIVILILVLAFLFGEVHGINTTPILAVLSPVVGALFLIKPLSSIGTGVQRTASQTNGHLSQLWNRNNQLAEENRQLREHLAALEGTENNG